MKKASKQKVLFLKEEYADGQGKYTYPNGESYVGDFGRRGSFMVKEPILRQMKESTKGNSRAEIEMVKES